MIAVNLLPAVSEGNDRTHVIGGVLLHPGHQHGGAATARGRGLWRGLEAVGSVESEFHGHLGISGRRNHVLRDQRIRSGGDLSA